MFLFLSQRAGWQVPRLSLTEDAFAKWRDSLSPDNQQLLQAWYIRDDNAVPPKYILQDQPRGSSSASQPANAAWQALAKLVDVSERRTVTGMEVDEMLAKLSHPARLEK